MGQETKIEWTDITSNPIKVFVDGKRSGWFCTKVSAGCANCYAERLNKRFGNKLDFAKQNEHRIEFILDQKELDSWKRIKEPKKIFVCDMTDFFHGKIPITYQTDIVEQMIRLPHLTFQVLTKRSLDILPRWNDIGTAVAYRLGEQRTPNFWPPKNIWLGVSVENQRMAKIRIPDLLRVKAAVRFLSIEPLLGPIDLTPYLAINSLYKAEQYAGRFNYRGERQADGSIITACKDGTIFYDGADIGWIIVGGESGPSARLMGENWVKQIVKQCQDAGVPVFVKQMGSVWAKTHAGYKDLKGSSMTFWPAELRIREFPDATTQYNRNQGETRASLA